MEFYEISHKELQVNYMGKENGAILGLSTRRIWVCHLGTNSGSPEVLRVMESQVAMVSVLHPPINNQCPLSPHQLASFVHFVFSLAQVSGFRKRVIVSRNLSIKASLLLL